MEQIRDYRAQVRELFVIQRDQAVVNRRDDSIEELDQLLQDENFDLEIQRNNSGSIHNQIINMIQGRQAEPMNRRIIESLRKVDYHSEKDRLTYTECSICLCAFTEYQEEGLIYLP